MPPSIARFGPSGPPVEYFVSLASELANVPATEGALAFENATLAWWVFRAGSSLATDPDLAVNGIGGQWLRLNLGHPHWTNQFTWFVSSAGSNKNAGNTSAAPVASISEIVRRLGPSPKIGGSDVTINILTSLTDPTPQTLDIEFTSDHALRILGTVQSAIYSGSFTAAYVAPARATAQRSQITDAAMSNFTTFGYQRVRMLSGAQAGATANIIKRTANTIAFTSSFVTVTPTTAIPSLSPVIVSPANGDTYQMDQLPILNELKVVVRKPFALAVRTALVVDSLEFLSTSYPLFEAKTGPGASTSNIGVVSRCIFRGARHRAENVSFQACQWTSLSAPTASGQYFQWACSTMGFTQVPMGASLVDFSGLTIFQGGANNAGGIAVPGSESPALVAIRRSAGRICGTVALAQVNDLGFGLFDSRNSALLLNGGTTVFAGGAAEAVVYGTGNTSWGIQLEPGSLFAYADGAKPTVTGAIGDTRIDGVTVAYGVLPAFTAGAFGGGVVGA